MLRPFVVALVFLTRLPWPLRGDLKNVDIGRSLLYYPLVGLLLGLLLAAVAVIMPPVAAELAAAALLMLWVMLTGGLHLDGLADSADAWAGGLGDRERTLAIMKDPYCGPSAVVLLILVLLLKWTALAALLGGEFWQGLLLAPLLGRAVVPLLYLTTDYVRPGGLGSALAANMPRRALIVLLVVLAVLLLAAGAWAALLAALFMLVLLRWLMQRRIGGATGDTTGATIELVEAAVLIAVVLSAAAG